MVNRPDPSASRSGLAEAGRGRRAAGRAWPGTYGFVTLAVLIGCEEPPADSGPCTVTAPARDLSPDVWETSGLALSRRSPGVLWTQNDSGNEPVLYALDTAGTMIGRVRVQGAELVDWEDLAAGPCDAGSCLFIGDIGDNPGRRDSISIYVVPEPAPTDSTTAPAIVFHARYPGRAQDAEAMFVLPSGDLYIVTKGRDDSIALYRYPKAEQRPGGSMTLERVRALWARPTSGTHRVTGASASPSGLRVAIRSYGFLHIYAIDSLLGSSEPRLSVDLRRIRESQGEGVVISDDGRVWLSSEGEGRRHLPQLSRLTCPMPD